MLIPGLVVSWVLLKNTVSNDRGKCYRKMPGYKSLSNPFVCQMENKATKPNGTTQWMSFSWIQVLYQSLSFPFTFYPLYPDAPKDEVTITWAWITVMQDLVSSIGGGYYHSHTVQLLCDLGYERLLVPNHFKSSHCLLLDKCTCAMWLGFT